MNKQLNPVPEKLTLPEIMRHFDSEDKARAYLEAIRWPSGPVCPHCRNAKQDSLWRIAANPAKKVRAGLIQCGACNKQFTVTVGTIFEDSHIPLSKWFIGWYLFASAKKGIAALELQRVLGLGSYRSALFMAHRIRHSLKSPVFDGSKFGGIVEVDETYIGGRATGRGRGYKRNKMPVVALVQRDGKARSRVMACVTAHNLKSVLRENVKPSATIMTDDFPAYRKATPDFAAHESVNHSAKEYARGNVHTNTVEGFFSMLKRGINGTFHHVSHKHLPLYLAEFDHRYNTRKMTDGERTIAGLQNMEGKRLTYATPKQA